VQQQERGRGSVGRRFEAMNEAQIRICVQAEFSGLRVLPEVVIYLMVVRPPYMHTYLKFGGLMVLIVGSLVWLAVGGVKETKTYYKTIPELQQMGAVARNGRVRVGGDVQPGSIVKSGSQTSFVLHQGATTLNVVYSGSDPLPDTFKDNSQALADGRLGSDGVFQASKVQAKCASKYESKPTQRGLSHDSAGQKITRNVPQTPATSMASR
jgi:cytochrome c-type biogenesis protein CcmE